MKSDKNYRIKILLIAELNNLSADLVEGLSKYKCDVMVYASKRLLWRKFLHEKDYGKGIVCIKKTGMARVICNYVVLIDNGESDRTSKKDIDWLSKKIELAVSVAKSNKAKALFIFSYLQSKKRREVTKKFSKKILKDNKFSAGVIYVGQAIGDGGFGGGKLQSLIEQALASGEITLSRDQKTFFPVYTKAVAKEIVKALFSFGVYGSTAAILSDAVTQTNFVESLKKHQPDVTVKYKQKVDEDLTPKTDHLIRTKCDYENTIREISLQKGRLKSIDGKVREIKRKKSRVKTPKIKKITKKKKVGIKKNKRGVIVRRLIIALLLTITTPNILVVFSLLSIFFAKESFYNGKFDLSQKAFLTSQFTSKAAIFCVSWMKNIPKIKYGMENANDVLVVISQVAKVGETGSRLARQSSKLYEEITGDGLYDTDEYTKEISAKLESLYQELGFLQGDFEELRYYPTWFPLGNYEDLDLAEIRKKVYFIGKLFDSLPKVFGKNQQNTIALILQDEKELRPSGGLVESIVLADFSDGKLVATKTLAADDIDSKLQGQTSPPLTLEKYLGEKNWYLKDSNWNPDFAEAAKQIAWFIEKETNKTVDVVVGIDNVVHKSILEVVEDQGNGYLLRIDKQKQLAVAKTIYKGLNDKHTQIYFKNDELEKVIKNIGWSGQLLQNNCLSNNCFSDWLMLAEANIGKNKANQFVKRNIELEVDFSDKKIRRELLVNIDNGKKESNEQNLDYRVFARLYVPKESDVGPVEILWAGEKELLEPELVELEDVTEAGVFLDIAPKSEKQAKFVWSSDSDLDFKKKGEYLLNWQKQAGTEEDLIIIKIHLPDNLKFTSIPGFTLTGPTYYGYNTSLSRDFISRIYW